MVDSEGGVWAGAGEGGGDKGDGCYSEGVD